MKDTQITITRDVSHCWRPDGTKAEMIYKPQKPQKIFFDWPDTLEMKDKNGNTHTYSITELLDGIKAFADWFKETKNNES